MTKQELHLALKLQPQLSPRMETVVETRGRRLVARHIAVGWTSSLRALMVGEASPRPETADA